MKEGWIHLSRQLEEITTLLTGKLPDYAHAIHKERGYQERLRGLYDAVANQVAQGATPKEKRNLEIYITDLTCDLIEQQNNIRGRNPPDPFPPPEQPDLPFDGSC